MITNLKYEKAEIIYPWLVQKNSACILLIIADERVEAKDPLRVDSAVGQNMVLIN